MQIYAKSCKLTRLSGQEEDPAGDFVPQVQSRATCDSITWGAPPSCLPPPDLLGLQPMFREFAR